MAGNTRLVDASGRSGFVITPDNEDEFEETKGLYIGATGDVTVDFAESGENITLLGLAPGVFHPIAVTRVYATGTTATGIRGVR